MIVGQPRDAVIDSPVVAMCAIFRLFGVSGMRWNVSSVRVQSVASESGAPALARRCRAVSGRSSPEQQVGHESSDCRSQTLAIATSGCRATASMIVFKTAASERCSAMARMMAGIGSRSTPDDIVNSHESVLIFQET
jgi:hypothetical protein